MCFQRNIFSVFRVPFWFRLCRVRCRTEITFTFAGWNFGSIIMMLARSISEDMQRANSVISDLKNASPSGRNSMYLSSSLLHPLRMHHTRWARASNPNTCISRQMSKLFLHDSLLLRMRTNLIKYMGNALNIKCFNGKIRFFLFDSKVIRNLWTLPFLSQISRQETAKTTFFLFPRTTWTTSRDP